MAIPDISTIKISQLNEASELQNNSVLVANVAGETKKITFGNVMNQIKGEINPQISNLAADLNQEKQTRAAADATLQENITNETNARTAADSDLNMAITNEATARASADAGLGDRIDAEATARTAADTAINSSINEINTALAGFAKNHIMQFSDSTPAIIALPPYYRGILITTDSTAANCGIFVLYSTYSGTSASYNAIVNASNINISAAGANMTLATNSGGCFAILIDINNNVSAAQTEQE